MTRFWLSATALCLLISLAIQPDASAISSSRVLIVYPANGLDSNLDGTNDSKQLADYYAQKRGIPAANILGVTITVLRNGFYYVGEYSTFYNDLVGPIKSRLAKLGPANIDVILLVGAIPTSVRNAKDEGVTVDNSLMMLSALDPKTNLISMVPNPYFEPTPSFGTDLGHFDHKFKHLGTHDIYMVSRLERMDQVDHALYADRFLSPEPGYYNGNMYVDSQWGQTGNGPNVPPFTDAFLASQVAVQRGDYYNAALNADMNIAFSERFVTRSGFPLKWENTTNGLVIGSPGAVFSDGTSATEAPRALFYGGWYNFRNYFDVWRWLPGSVACDLNSASTFGVEALNHGASAAAYAWGEPYRTGHQRPHVLIYYLLNGYSFAEASTLSTPTMGWMAINSGDPLYAPTAPKKPIKDTFAPTLGQGYPIIAGGAQRSDRIVHLMINDTNEPEVVLARVDYGTDTNYGSTATSRTGYSKRPTVALTGLKDRTLYHYRVTLEDPVGNVTVTGDLTFNTSRQPERRPPPL